MKKLLFAALLLLASASFAIASDNNEQIVLSQTVTETATQVVTEENTVIAFLDKDYQYKTSSWATYCATPYGSCQLVTPMWPGNWCQCCGPWGCFAGTAW